MRLDLRRARRRRQSSNGSETVRFDRCGNMWLTAFPTTNLSEIPHRSMRKMAKTPAVSCQQIPSHTLHRAPSSDEFGYAANRVTAKDAREREGNSSTTAPAFLDAQIVH